MATRFLRLPTLIIATSLTAVFRNDFAIEFEQGLKFSEKYRFYLKRLVLFGLFFFIIIIWFVKLLKIIPILNALVFESLFIGCLFALLRWKIKTLRIF